MSPSAELDVVQDGAVSLTRLEQSDVNVSRTFGCKSLIIFERALGSEKV
jgi:hypothetical protein